MWFKKKAKISGYNANTAVDGTDWRKNGHVNNWSVSQTLPSAADAGNFFYLPALGFYGEGNLYLLGIFGNYWSSNAFVSSEIYAYGLRFNSGIVYVNTNFRNYGFRVEPSFE